MGALRVGTGGGAAVFEACGRPPTLWPRLTLLVGCTRASTSYTRALEIRGHHSTLIGRNVSSGRFTNCPIARQELELRCTSPGRRQLFWPGPSWNRVKLGQGIDPDDTGLQIIGPRGEPLLTQDGLDGVGGARLDCRQGKGQPKPGHQ